MAFPLVIPVAIGAFELVGLAAVTIAGLWAASPQGQKAGRAGAQALSQALSKPQSIAVPIAPSIPRTCSEPNCDDRCGPLLAKIHQVMGQIRERIAAMEVDKYNLYRIRPAAIPGIGSWPGHIQQFRSKQAQLRRLLTEAGTNGCPIPPGAWLLASRNPPNRPFR
jgi:hypothetical protein